MTARQGENALNQLIPRVRVFRAAVAAAMVALLAVAVLPLAGCGNESNAGAKPELKIAAAASLKQPFERYARSLESVTVRESFAGSDMLAAQIEQGFPADVFAAANTELPERLHQDGLVKRPIAFATNSLTIGVVARENSIDSIADLARPGLRIAVGSATVPIGKYTARLLGRLDSNTQRAIARNIHSREPDVNGIVGKLIHGAVDAGIVYRTDIKSAGGRLRAIELPKKLRPEVVYAAAVVVRGANQDAAAKYISGLRTGGGRATLAAAGFGPPPGEH